MGLNVLQDIVFNRPTKEIQLTNRRLHHCIFSIIKVNPVPSAKGVKLTLGIGFQLALVRFVHIEPPPCLWKNVTDVVFTAVIRHEPINDPQ